MQVYNAVKVTGVTEFCPDSSDLSLFPLFFSLNGSCSPLAPGYLMGVEIFYGALKYTFSVVLFFCLFLVAASRPFWFLRLLARFPWIFYLLCDLPLILFQHLTVDGYLGLHRSRLNGNSGISTSIEKRNAVRDQCQVRRGRINALCMLEDVI